MDMTHHKPTNTSNWDPYNNIPVEDHNYILQTHHQTPFDQYNYPLPTLPMHPTHYQLSTTSSSMIQLVSTPNLVGADPTLDLKVEARDEEDEDDQEEELGAMKEMMFKIASMQPVDIDPATIRKPKRRNVRISDDPQSVAARHRRERISEKIRILQRLVPGGTKMDTASMLDEAIRYVKFLKRQIRLLQANQHQLAPPPAHPVEEWVATDPTAATILGVNYCSNNGAGLEDDPMCFNNKF